MDRRVSRTGIRCGGIPWALGHSSATAAPQASVQSWNSRPVAKAPESDRAM